MKDYKWSYFLPGREEATDTQQLSLHVASGHAFGQPIAKKKQIGAFFALTADRLARCPAPVAARSWLPGQYGSSVPLWPAVIRRNRACFIFTWYQGGSPVRRPGRDSTAHQFFVASCYSGESWLFPATYYTNIPGITEAVQSGDLAGTVRLRWVHY